MSTKNTQWHTEGWDKAPGNVDPRFAAGLPFPVPEILELKAFCDSGKIFQHFSRSFRALFLGENPNRPRKKPQPSRVF